jgi:TonB family protein
VNICKISRFIVVGLSFLFTFQAMAAIQVVVRDSGGSEELIELYSNYHALVIGASDYQTGWRDLPNAVSDAREVSALLKDLGWNVDLLENPDGKTLNLKLNDLIVSTASDQEKAVLVWFSGHGHTEVRADGSPFGYLVPVDSPDPYSDRAGFLGTAISMDRIKSVSTQLRAKHVLMMFDSCFSGTLFSATRAMSPSPYIKRKVEGQVRQYITAGQAEETVPDRSVFKQSFIDGVQDGEADFNQDGYITGTELGSYLTEKVANYTNGAQNPLFGKIQNPYLNKGDFVFLNPAYDDQVSQNPQAKPREMDRRVLDLAFWQEIKSSSDPALYEEYLNQFPQGVFSGLATIRLAKLRAPKDSGHSATTVDSKSVWCATNDLVLSMSKYYCDARSGKSYSSEQQAQAEHQRLKKKTTTASSSSRVWCASPYRAFSTSKKYCNSKNWKSFSTKTQAQREHQRLKGTATPSTASAERERIEALLTRALTAFDTDRLIDPPEENALTLYRAALDLDPTNQRARNGIGNITAFYLRQARDALSQNELSNAARSLQIAKAVDPTHAGVDTLIEHLQRREYLVTEQQRLQAEADARIAKAREMVNEHEAVSAFGALAWAIQQRVSSNWSEPGDFSGMSVAFLVKVDRDGNVISATITKKSGDARLDESAENAIFKSSPLPFPTEPRYYEYLKEFNFVFKP